MPGAAGDALALRQTEQRRLTIEFMPSGQSASWRPRPHDGTRRSLAGEAATGGAWRRRLMTLAEAAILAAEQIRDPGL
jgi:hypothetical protein